MTQRLSAMIDGVFHHMHGVLAREGLIEKSLFQETGSEQG